VFSSFATWIAATVFGCNCCGVDMPKDTPEALKTLIAQSGDCGRDLRRAAHGDIGPYRRFDLKPAPGPIGPPGSAGNSSTIYFVLDQDVMDRSTSDWAPFLTADSPERVALALKQPLDILADPSRAPNDTVAVPQLLKNGSLEFYIQDGNGDPPSLDLFKVNASPQPKGGIKITKTRP